MGVEFPSRWSTEWIFHSTESNFRDYVSSVCAERGYSNNQSWDVNYSARERGAGNLKSHLDSIFTRFEDNLRGYKRTRRWAQTAADTICPERSRSPSGQGMKFPFLAFLIFQGFQVFFSQFTINQGQNYNWEEITAFEPETAAVEDDFSDMETEFDFTDGTDVFEFLPPVYYEAPAPVIYP